MSVPKPPEILDKIVDLVLAHRPRPKSKAAKKRTKAAPSDPNNIATPKKTKTVKTRRDTNRPTSPSALPKL